MKTSLPGISNCATTVSATCTSAGVVGGEPHFALSRDPLVEEIMQTLKDHRFSGSLTLEIEDLTFDHTLSSQEKVDTLAADCAFMQECMR